MGHKNSGYSEIVLQAVSEKTEMPEIQALQKRAQQKYQEALKNADNYPNPPIFLAERALSSSDKPVITPEWVKTLPPIESLMTAEEKEAHQQQKTGMSGNNKPSSTMMEVMKWAYRPSKE